MRSSTLPSNWRDRLPPPADYYNKHLEQLTPPNAAGYAQARCPYHDDSCPSLSVKLTGARGLFRCFGCGAHGDMIAFEMKRTGLPFAAAVRSLMEVR